MHSSRLNTASTLLLLDPSKHHELPIMGYRTPFFSAVSATLLADVMEAIMAP